MSFVLLLAASLSAASLPPCPAKPNCVLTSFAFTGDPGAAWARLKTTLEAEPRTAITVEEPGHIKAIAVSRVFRFKDDLEFVLGEGRIDVRSASRMGYADFGVNRKRVERLRRAFEARP